MSLIRTLTFLVTAFAVTYVAAAPSEPDIAHYTELRWTLFNQPSFNPYGAQAAEKAITDECMKLWRNGKGADAFAKCKEALVAYPTSILANRMLADMFKTYASSPSATEIQQEQLRKLEAPYRSASEGFIQSVLSSGDGKTPDTAYRVITISEEYMLIWYFGCSKIEQTLVTQGEKKFDALRVRDENGDEKTIYFDVSPLAKKFGA